MMQRHCSVCGSTAHDRRTCPKLAGKPRPRNYRRALKAHRRNPETAQLNARFEGELERLSRYQERGKHRGYRRTERAAERTQEAMAHEPAEHPPFFMVKRGGKWVRIPERLNLMEQNSYNTGVDIRPTKEERQRHHEYEEHYAQQDADQEYKKERAKEKARARYDPAKAKAARERRKAGIVVISPDWKKKHQEEVYSAAVKAGKSVEFHSRSGRVMSLAEVMKHENTRQHEAKRRSRAARINRSTSRRFG